jgi:putative ABC transport system permease protein
MKTPTLLRRSLVHYWQTNVAVVLGVVAATAVIAGALLVGDSVRDSLRQMSLDRLGEVDHALVGQRFVRQAMADELQAELPSTAVVAPALVMPGSLQVRSEAGDATVRRAGHVNVYGVESRFWKLAGQEYPDFSLVVNETLARQAGLKVKDRVSVVIEIPAAIPRDALLGEREETNTELSLEVSAIAPDSSMPGRFGLNPTQQLPLNAFVPLEVLQKQIGLGEVKPTPRNPIAKPARVNALFVGGAGPIDPTESTRLTQFAAKHITLEDLGLRFRPNEDHGYVSLESDRMILENGLATTATRLHPGDQTSPVLVYLLNEIHSRKDPAKYGMYSVVAGVDFTQSPPFGPFDYIAGAAPTSGDPSGVVINDWLAEDLAAEVGDEIDVKYHVVGDRGELPEAEQSFKVTGIVKLDGPAADRGYSPDVPGVTDAESYDDWREPFPLKRGQITERDDEYWPQHRTTPKIFLPLKPAQDLWKSRYGELTSIRFAPAEGQSLQALTDDLTPRLLQSLTPLETGVAFQPVKDQGLRASEKSGDFTGLFIGFSFFLIIAAALLIGLLFRLGIERRVRELGLLAAVGWSPARIRREFLLEGGLLVLIGVGLGLAAAVGYAALMMYGLRTWWVGAVGTRFLFLSVHPLTLIFGGIASIVVSLLAILWGLRQARLLSPREQLVGATESSRPSSATATSKARWIGLVASALALLLLVASLGGLVPQTEAFGGFSWSVITFFLVGVAALVGTLGLFAWWLAADHATAVRGAGTAALARLGLRNASRSRSRSLLTASLLASATFVIVAVATGQRNPAVEEPVKSSGNGGFTLVAETNQPILYDLNTDFGKAKLGIEQYYDAKSTWIAPFRVKPGEDASCLNIYRTSTPTILGVSDSVIDEFAKSKRFRFADTRTAQPWELLRTELPEGRIPVLGDMNTLMYSLHKGIGDVIPAPADAQSPLSPRSGTPGRGAGGEGQTVPTPSPPQSAPSPTQSVPPSPPELEVRGMFDGSVFQGVLLMSETNFLRLFPDRAGYEYFLIECPQFQADGITSLLETKLADSGLDAQRVSDRLADFLAVQNTYLSTFQTLGGLGLLLGTLGLATVMLRNVLERRSELALLRAVGYTEGAVAALVLWENICLLLIGVACGAGSALLAMSPHLASTGADVPWTSLTLLLLAVIAIGLLAAGGAVREAIRTPIVSTLRNE